MRIYRTTAFHLCLLGLACFFVFGLGISGGFYFDDEANIHQNGALHLDHFDLGALAEAANSGTAGPLGRPVAMISFALNHVLSGLSPEPYKWINIAIHFVNSVLLYLLSIRLFKLARSTEMLRAARLLAFSVAFIWMVAPINLTPALYVVQRMTSLSAMFCFAGLLCYVLGRVRLQREEVDGWFWVVGAYVICLPLAVLSKENGVLLLLYLFVLEWVFWGFTSPKRLGSIKIRVLHVICFVTPALLVAVFLVVKFGYISNGYLVRDFSLEERLFTEFRVLVFYLQSTVVPVGSLLGMHHDDFVVSTSLFEPITTLISFLFLVFLFTVGLGLRRISPISSFGILLFFCAHLIESTIVPLELVHEHRNYLGSYGVHLMVVSLLWFGYSCSGLNAKRAILIFWTSYALYALGSTAYRAANWSNPIMHALYELENHPESPRAHYRVGRLFAVYAANHPLEFSKQTALIEARKHFVEASTLGAAYTDGLFGLLFLEKLEGIPMGEELYREWLRRLEFEAFNMNNYNYLHSVMACVESGECNMTLNELQEINQAINGNPGFRGRAANQVRARLRGLL